MPEFNVRPHYFSASGGIPNNLELPLLLYQQVFAGNDNPEQRFKEAFRQNNWGGSWINGVFSYHHYHSNAHEVLGVLEGSAMLLLGGPDGEEVAVQAGDMVVLPAGTGHCRKSATPDFKVIGAYPEGQEDYDICTEKDKTDEKKKNIARVPMPAADPVGGPEGPLMHHWK